MTITAYLRQLQESQNRRKMVASRDIAAALFSRRSIPSMSRRIRVWATQFLNNQALSDHRQGKHVKIISLIDEKFIRSCCLAWLRSQRNDLTTALSFFKWGFEHLSLVVAFSRPVSIYERTSVRWVKRLHYKFGQYCKRRILRWS